MAAVHHNRVQPNPMLTHCQIIGRPFHPVQAHTFNIPEHGNCNLLCPIFKRAASTTAGQQLTFWLS